MSVRLPYRKTGNKELDKNFLLLEQAVNKVGTGDSADIAGDIVSLVNQHSILLSQHNVDINTLKRADANMGAMLSSLSTQVVDINARVGSLESAISSVTGIMEPDGWDDQMIYPTNVKLPAQNPATWVAYKSVLETLSFSGTQKEYVHFDVQIPHKWKRGSDYYFHIHFSPSVTANNESVVFKLDWCKGEFGGTFGSVTTHTYVKALGTSAADTFMVASLSATTDTWNDGDTWNNGDTWGTGGENLFAKDASYSHILKCRLYRDPTDSNDTYTSPVYVHGMDFHIPIDKFGSVTQWG